MDHGDFIDDLASKIIQNTGEPHPVRIDNMKWAEMQQIHGLVGSVRAYANTHIEVEDHIVQVTEQIEDICAGRIGPKEYTAITSLLKGLVSFVRTHRFEENDHEVIVVTGNIIKLIQGENTVQNNSPLTVMTFRRVKEAIQKVAHDGVDFTDERISNVSEQYANKIVEDVFGGKQPVPLNLEQLEGRLYILVKEVAEWVRAHPEKDIVETVETFGGVIDALLGKGAKKGHSFLPDPSFVNKYYEIDPETEDVLHNGTLVIDDMKVLIESEVYRVEIKANMTEGELYKARERNRWAIVTESAVVGLNSLQFIALYDDGTKRKIKMDTDLAWIVKKDSIPRIDTILEVFLEGNTHRSYSGPTKKVVEILKGDLTREQWSRFRIQTGEDGDVLTLEEYMAIEDPQPEPSPEEEVQFDVIAPEGNRVLTGTAAQVVEYLESKTPSYRQGCSVFEHNNGREFVSGLVFLMNNVDELVYTVWNEEGMHAFQGTVRQIREWSETFTKREGFEVGREGVMGGVSLKDFLLSNEANQG